MKIELRLLGIHPREEGGLEAVVALDCPLGDATFSVPVDRLNTAEAEVQKAMDELGEAIMNAAVMGMLGRPRKGR